MSSQPHIVVERTIRIVSRAPYDEAHYPEMSLVQAMDYELQLPRDEKILHFAEGLNNADPHEVELTERVRVER